LDGDGEVEPDQVSKKQPQMRTKMHEILRAGGDNGGEKAWALLARHAIARSYNYAPLV
jgi:hypothetical protein